MISTVWLRAKAGPATHDFTINSVHFQLTTNKRAQREVHVMFGFLIIPFLIASVPSSSLPSFVSDRSSRDARVSDDRHHQPAMSLRDHESHASAARFVEALKGVLCPPKGVYMPVAAPCDSCPASTCSPEAARGNPDVAVAASPPALAQEVSLSGWFTTIWNDKPHYFLTDDQGRLTELLLDAEMTKPFGGPLAFNRKRVKVVGERVSAPPGGVRVLSIEFE